MTTSCEKNIDQKFLASAKLNPAWLSSRFVSAGFFILNITCHAFENTIRMLFITGMDGTELETGLLSKVKTIS
jgi:hypothetical protein